MPPEPTSDEFREVSQETHVRFFICPFPKCALANEMQRVAVVAAITPTATDHESERLR